jgi:Secretion system C-terminal sorting domain
MLKYILLITFLINNITYSQTYTPLPDAKCGNVWMHGYESFGHNIDNNFGTSHTDFGICNLNQYFKYSDFDIVSTSTVMCDTSGKMIFYTNGFTVGDITGHKMLNGDSLCYPYNTYPDGSYAIQGAIAMPLPNNPYIYKIFHHAPPLNNTVSILYSFLETTIDIRGNNGKGIVSNKNYPRMENDTTNGVFFTFCRHGNGRDWWMIRPDWNLHHYYRFLLNPNGLDSLPQQILPMPPANQRGAQKTSNSFTYSPDGSKFAHRAASVGIWLYDFDRCSGSVSNRRLIPRPNLYIGEIFAGIAFSPNSRYLYCTTDTSVVQYDTEATDIAASVVTVGIADGVRINNLNTNFYQPTLAPDGKIYINGPGGCQIWHTIHNPDGVGTTCDLRLHDRTLTTLYYGTTPNQANFRLGALRGSPCDTLGIEEGAEYVCVPYVSTVESPSLGDLGSVRVYPNPTNGNITIDNISTHTSLQIFNVLGQAVHTQNLNIGTNSLHLNLEAGTYFVRINGQNDTFLNTKLTIIK